MVVALAPFSRGRKILMVSPMSQPKTRASPDAIDKGRRIYRVAPSSAPVVNDQAFVRGRLPGPLDAS
ncbi:hypothetical protein GCM10025883_19330 [Mobilicoccus caccae]|uniref:Uncharacterized protein n=1 Tax=Mobilicoccus caccae TaxID=1859295 RepID=A0ABQ6IT80_9MICO|nr:hypothetical protein GCM10025883_19330 [Mobilicoccus caccae]